MFQIIKKHQSVFSNFLIASCIFLSIVSAYLFIRSYHKETSQQFIKDFTSQNAAIISSGDTYELVYRLNQLSNNRHWKCISLKENNLTIFSRSTDNNCSSGLFQTLESLVVPENKKFELIFTIALPSILKTMLFSFVFFQFFVLIIIIFLQRAEHKKRELLSNNWKKKITEIVSQVVHDIRSPLAALKFILQSSNMIKIQYPPLNSKVNSLFSSSVKRVEDILQDLLFYKIDTNFLLKNEDVQKNSICDVDLVINNVIIEKQALIAALDKQIHLQYEKNDEAQKVHIKIPVEEKELYRIISNIINNSIEAFDTKPSTSSYFPVITLSLNLLHDRESNQYKVIISIKDNGRGIPKEKIQEILKHGGTYNKPGGQGLGLKHAINIINKAHGHLHILSTADDVNHYTDVSITFFIQNTIEKIPLLKYQSKEQLFHDLKSVPRFVLIDDDIYLQEYWRMAAELIQVELVCCQSEDEFLQYHFPLNSLVFIDKNLQNNQSGFEIAKNLREKFNYTNLYLLTGEEIETRNLPSYFKDSIKNKNFPKKLILSSFTNSISLSIPRLE